MPRVAAVRSALQGPPGTALNALGSYNTYVPGLGLTPVGIDVYYPPGQQSSKLPVGMAVHGGGWFGGGRHDLAGEAALCLSLASMGFVMFNVDYLLCATSPNGLVTTGGGSPTTTITCNAVKDSDGIALSIPANSLVNAQITKDGITHARVISHTTGTSITINLASPGLNLTNGDTWLIIGLGAIHMQNEVNSLVDAVAACRANAPTFGGDPDNLSFFGGSAGGHLVEMLWMTNCLGTFKPKAVAAFSGPAEMYDPTGVAFSSAGVQSTLNAMGTFQAEDKANWDAMSPALSIGDAGVLSPLWVGCGAGESAFYNTPQALLAAKANARRGAVTAWTWAGATHQWGGLSISNTMFASFLPWVQANVPPGRHVSLRPVMSGVRSAVA